MSRRRNAFTATNWAQSQRLGEGPGIRYTLMTLAAYADDEASCYPKLKTIADETEQGVSTVRRQLDRLEELGLIRIEERLRSDGGRTSNRYYLQLDVVIDKPRQKLRPRGKSAQKPAEMDTDTDPDRPRSSGSNPVPNLDTPPVPNFDGGPPQTLEDPLLSQVDRGPAPPGEQGIRTTKGTTPEADASGSAAVADDPDSGDVVDLFGNPSAPSYAEVKRAAVSALMDAWGSGPRPRGRMLEAAGREAERLAREEGLSVDRIVALARRAGQRGFTSIEKQYDIEVGQGARQRNGLPSSAAGSGAAAADRRSSEQEFLQRLRDRGVS